MPGMRCSTGVHALMQSAWRTSVYSPLKPMKWMRVASAPKLVGMCKSTQCTPLNFGMLQAPVHCCSEEWTYPLMVVMATVDSGGWTQVPYSAETTGP